MLGGNSPVRDYRRAGGQQRQMDWKFSRERLSSINIVAHHRSSIYLARGIAEQSGIPQAKSQVNILWNEAKLLEHSRRPAFINPSSARDCVRLLLLLLYTLLGSIAAVCECAPCMRI